MDYQDIKNFALKTANEVKRTSEKLYNSAKLSVQVSKKEAEIEDKLIQIGKLIYEAHSGCETNGERVGHICEEIDVLYTEISKLEQQKDYVKALKKCQVCGCSVHPGNRECPNCGCEL